MAEQLIQTHPGTSRSPAVLETEQRDKYLTFTLGRDTFAMEIGFIKEIIQYGTMTVVPLMPGFIRGVINLRGSVVPVIDLSVRIDRPPTEENRRTCVVILEIAREGGPMVLGVMVDNVSEVLEMAASDIEPTPAFGNSLRPDFISGVGKVGGQFVIILDVNKTLSIEEMAAMERSGPGVSGAA